MLQPANMATYKRITRFIVLLILVRLCKAIQTVTIFNYPSFRALQPCAKECLWHLGEMDDLMAAGLGCTAPWVNDCLCRTDLAIVASDFVTSCCSKRCTISSPASDIAAAVAVYHSYCETNSFDVTAVPTNAMETSKPCISCQYSTWHIRIWNVSYFPLIGPGAVPRKTNQSQATATGDAIQDNSIGGGGSHHKLSKVAFVAIMVSVGCFVIGLV